MAGHRVKAKVSLGGFAKSRSADRRPSGSLICASVLHEGTEKAQKQNPQILGKKSVKQWVW
jgi:hypothetical protein